MNRRGFLASILALGAAPAIVHAASLMKVAAPLPAEYEWVEEKIDLVNEIATCRPLMQGEWGRYMGFRFIEGTQWTSEERMVLTARAASPLVVNKITPAILTLHPTMYDDLKRSA